MNYLIRIKIVLLTLQRDIIKIKSHYMVKSNPDIACQDEYMLNTDELPPLIITDGYLYGKKKTKGLRFFYA